MHRVICSMDTGVSGSSAEPRPPTRFCNKEIKGNGSRIEPKSRGSVVEPKCGSILEPRMRIEAGDRDVTYKLKGNGYALATNLNQKYAGSRNKPNRRAMGLWRGIKGARPEHEIHSNFGLPSEDISSCLSTIKR